MVRKFFAHSFYNAPLSEKLPTVGQHFLNVSSQVRCVRLPSDGRYGSNRRQGKKLGDLSTRIFGPFLKSKNLAWVKSELVCISLVPNLPKKDQEPPSVR